jgi:hypothetical protein
VIVKVSHDLFETSTISLFNTGLISRELEVSYFSILSKYGYVLGNKSHWLVSKIMLQAEAEIPAFNLPFAKLAV